MFCASVFEWQAPALAVPRAANPLEVAQQLKL
jgi:hypothetical protein